MSTATQTALLEVHRLAVQQDLTRALKTEEDWSHFNAIAREAAERIDAELVDYQRTYPERIAEARQTILREQNARPLEPPKPSWAVQNHEGQTPDRLEALAQARVRAEHTGYIAAVRQDEVAQYRTLRGELREREDRRAHAHAVRKNHARDAFNLTWQHQDIKRSR
ncbi:MAG: hypothetical protein AAGE90_16270 [Pseudomonadota bacterium]